MSRDYDVTARLTFHERMFSPVYDLSVIQQHVFCVPPGKYFNLIVLSGHTRIFGLVLVYPMP